MKRFVFRFAAAALALGATATQLLCIAWIARAAPFAADAVVTLPHVIVSPAAPCEAPGDSRQAASAAPSPRT